jgi:hypothetical protein
VSNFLAFFKAKEVLALYDSIPYVIWLRDLLSELGYAQGSPTVIEQDNKSALPIYEKGWSKSDRTRHISIKYSYITEQISDGVIKPVYVPTEEIRADILTKPLGGSKFHAFYDGSKVARKCVALLARSFRGLCEGGE